MNTDLSELSSSAGSHRVVLGHDWLTGMRGGEKVLQYFAGAFPSATIATLLANPSALSPDLASHPLCCSFLDRIPGIARRYRSFLPLMPLAARSLRVPPADLLLTTSHCVAKGFRKPRGSRHVCYCFTPMRYAWLFREEYLGRGLKSALARPLLAYLRDWDKRASDNVDRFVAISHCVADRIRDFYGRDSDLVYPPVDTDFYTPSSATQPSSPVASPLCHASPSEGIVASPLCHASPPKGAAACPLGATSLRGRAPAGRAPASFDLVVSALVPYKRIDLAVRAYTRANLPLKVVGTGTGTERLKSLAGPTIEFLGWRTNEEIRELYRSCRMLVFPGEEDFGIVPLEAMACGRPVVAYARGGALDTVADGISGLFFSEQTEDSLLDAVSRAASIDWSPAAIRAHAETFGPSRFVSEMARVIQSVLA